VATLRGQNVSIHISLDGEHWRELVTAATEILVQLEDRAWSSTEVFERLVEGIRRPFPPVDTGGLRESFVTAAVGNPSWSFGVAISRDTGERAKELLFSCLTDEQKQCAKDNGHFIVNTEHNRYEIDMLQGTVGNIYSLDDNGRRVLRYCVAPSGVPFYDVEIFEK